MTQTVRKGFSVSAIRRDQATEPTEPQKDNVDAEPEVGMTETSKDRRIPKRGDAVRVIDAETSIKYMKSNAYEMTYGKDPVWTNYRRNFKGQFAPKLRKKCIRDGKIATGSPCPVCRDEYLVLDYRNTDLLEQFVSEQSGEVLPIKKVNICEDQYKTLQVEVLKAKDRGYIEEYVPFREYNYDDYLDSSNNKNT